MCRQEQKKNKTAAPLTGSNGKGHPPVPLSEAVTVPLSEGVTVIVPTLNAAGTLAATVATVAWAAEIMVADGGSTNDTGKLAELLGARIIAAPRGRGTQLATGVAAASHAWLLLLHADTRLGPEANAIVRTHMTRHPGRAGYFRFELDSGDPRARRLERLVAWRCRMLALPYGDQGLLIHHDLLRDVGGIRPLPLMEDVDLVRRLGRHRLVVLDAAATTSAAKWEREGWLRHSVRNLCCLGLWFAGVAPDRIARLYR